METFDFPVSEYLRDNILDARTVSKRGPWWTALLVINDPETKKTYVAFYKWKKNAGAWKKMTSFRINSLKHLEIVKKALDGFGTYLS